MLNLGRGHLVVQGSKCSTEIQNSMASENIRSYYDWICFATMTLKIIQTTRDGFKWMFPDCIELPILELLLGP